VIGAYIGQVIQTPHPQNVFPTTVFNITFLSTGNDVGLKIYTKEIKHMFMPYHQNGKQSYYTKTANKSFKNSVQIFANNRKLKVKSFTCLTKYHPMKTYGGVEVRLHIFSGLALEKVGLSVSRPGRFTPGKEPQVPTG
jgi:hypothetical protein